jgi:hypothetical protein
MHGDRCGDCHRIFCAGFLEAGQALPKLAAIPETTHHRDLGG